MDNVHTSSGMYLVWNNFKIFSIGGLNEYTNFGVIYYCNTICM